MKTQKKEKNGLYHGIVAALTIPTDADGNIIKDALKANVDWLVDKRISGFMVLGSTGEFLRFDYPHRQKVVEAVAEANNGRVKLIANCTASNIKETIELANLAKKNKYTGISLMPQFFYPQSQADMLEYFLRCDEKYDLPTLLYNFPERTGTRSGIDVVRSFAASGNMFAMKQSGSEYYYHFDLIEAAREFDFSLFSGFDTRLADVFRIGAAGCIGGLVNIVPEYMYRIYASIKLGVQDDVKTLTERIAFVGKVIDNATFPINVQFGMKARGLETGVPKEFLSKETIKIGEEIVNTLRKKFEEWGLSTTL